MNQRHEKNLLGIVLNAPFKSDHITSITTTRAQKKHVLFCILWCDKFSSLGCSLSPRIIQFQSDKQNHQWDVRGREGHVKRRRKRRHQRRRRRRKKHVYYIVMFADINNNKPNNWTSNKICVLNVLPAPLVPSLRFHFITYSQAHRCPTSHNDDVCHVCVCVCACVRRIKKN